MADQMSRRRFMELSASSALGVALGSRALAQDEVKPLRVGVVGTGGRGCGLLNTMLHMIQDESDIGSKTIYPDFMEARVHYQKDTIKQFGDIISAYQAWYDYMIEKHQVEVSELVFPQTSKL